MISFAQNETQIQKMLDYVFHESTLDAKRAFAKSDRWQVLKKARKFRPKTAFS